MQNSKSIQLSSVILYGLLQKRISNYPLIWFMAFRVLKEHTRNVFKINIIGCYFTYKHGQENKYCILSCVISDTQLYVSKETQVRLRKS